MSNEHVDNEVPEGVSFPITDPTIIEKLDSLTPEEMEKFAAVLKESLQELRKEKVVEERDELRDELSSLCEEIRILKEENDELRDELEQLGDMVSAKKEHTNTHFNDKDNFVGITGYGQFSLKQVDKDRWEIHMLNEKVTLYNKKGHRVRGHHNHDGDW